MLAAPKQRTEIVQFDSRVLENFRLPEGQVPRRPNQQILGPDEMRKKKKVRWSTNSSAISSHDQQKPHVDDGLVVQSSTGATIKLQGQ